MLFSLFINDFEMYLLNNSCDGIDIEYSDEYIKFLILLYADDTVILSAST